MSGGGTHFSGDSYTLDANDDTKATDWLDIGEDLYVSFAVQAISGANTTHVLELQCSLDKVQAYNTGDTITGLGINRNNLASCNFVRVKVKTAEGGASSVKVLINAK